MKMYRSVCVPAGLLVLLILTLVVSRSQSCPRSCNCYQANEVHCTFRSLLNIPPGLPSHTRRINFGYWKTDSKFVLHSKLKIKSWFTMPLHPQRQEQVWEAGTVMIVVFLCFCRFNSITRLHEKSLAGLKKVELLMLHSNNLHHLPDGVFKDMKSLQVTGRKHSNNLH